MAKVQELQSASRKRPYIDLNPLGCRKHPAFEIHGRTFYPPAVHHNFNVLEIHHHLKDFPKKIETHGFPQISMGSMDFMSHCQMFERHDSQTSAMPLDELLPASSCSEASGGLELDALEA